MYNLVFNLQGDPGPMVPKGNNCKHNKEMAENMRTVNALKVMLELTDSKTPKVKKRAKKDDHDSTVKKKVSLFYFLIVIMNSRLNFSNPFRFLF